MKLTLNGTEYQAGVFSLLDVSIGEARDIKRHTGMTISDWQLGLLTSERQDPDVLAAIVLVLRRRAGEDVDWAEIETLSTVEVSRAVTLEPGDYELPDEMRRDGAEGGEQETSGESSDSPEDPVAPEPAATNGQQPDTPPTPDATAPGQTAKKARAKRATKSRATASTV